MNTYTRLSTISTSDIKAIRDIYQTEDNNEQSWFRKERPRSSLSSAEEREKGAVRMEDSVYKELSNENEEDTVLCGTMRNQVND
jgi:hypothetical protein